MKSILSMQLLISVGVSFIGIFACLIAVFFNLGGWGIALSIWFLLNSNVGWRSLKGGIGIDGVKHNGEGAIALAVFTNLLVGLGLAASPPSYSSMWGVLTPVIFLAETLTLQIAYEWMLNLAYSKNKRP